MIVRSIANVILGLCGCFSWIRLRRLYPLGCVGIARGELGRDSGSNNRVVGVLFYWTRGALPVLIGALSSAARASRGCPGVRSIVVRVLSTVLIVTSRVDDK